MIIINLIFFIVNIYFSLKFAQEVICGKTNDFWSIIAPPGTGKSCLASKIVRDGLKVGKKTYSNVAIRGAIKIDIKKDLGTYDLRNCNIIIDEAGSVLNNRNWHSNLDDNFVDFIKKHRHYNVNIYCFSQAPNDFDNKLRDLVTKVYLLNKSKVPFMVYAQALHKIMKLEGGTIVSYLEETKADSFRFFLPVTWAYFNSYDKNMLLKKHNDVHYTILDV